MAATVSSVKLRGKGVTSVFFSVLPALFEARASINISTLQHHSISGSSLFSGNKMVLLQDDRETQTIFFPNLFHKLVCVAFIAENSTSLRYNAEKPLRGYVNIFNHGIHSEMLC